MALGRFGPAGILVTNYTDTFGYRKAITIAISQVGGSTDLVDFPVLISITDPDLALVAGKVRRADAARVFHQVLGGFAQRAPSKAFLRDLIR